MRNRIRNGRAQGGFTLVEMLTVVAVLTLVLGVVFTQMSDLLKKYKSEDSKIDITQQAREFMDQIVRDLHQAGYPSLTMFDSSATTVPEQRYAVGLLSYSATDLWFEGDIDGDGTVNVVRYTLFDDSNQPAATGGGNCPCTLKRSQIQKLPGVTESYNVETQNVLNSNSGNPKTIAGTAPTGSSNDTLYAAYKAQSVFAAYDKDGNYIAPTSTPATLATIRTIRITMNVMAQDPNLDTRMRPAVSMSANARVGNNL